MSRSDDWSSYDEAASTFDAISVPAYFTRPARRLIGMSHLSASDRLLDVGSGTGIVAACALEMTPFVIGLDLSCSMLLRAMGRNVRNCVAATATQLPFDDGSFTRLTASFVLNHVSDLDLVLREFARVITIEGSIGVTTWAAGPSDCEAARAWSEVAAEFVDPVILTAQEDRALPNERRLAHLQSLGEVLSGAGFTIERLEQLEFDVRIPTGDYLRSRSIGMTARFIKQYLDPVRWRQCAARASEQVNLAFGPQLEFSTRVNFAVGKRNPLSRRDA